ncbi:hypothetical protein OH76DRAFT_1556247 [Lentinus brumalis]|uniref:MYND-type domain-containing protein n=1 Tax=Lentinus brumalis TaxID=2498619 RepID=A0A371DBB3_9APHY|nr:hypothetical protein OH76DRAFT_1556247 [Polyporus brumalis]
MQAPRRIVRARDVYASAQDSEYIESLEIELQIAHIRSRLNLPCVLKEDGRPENIRYSTLRRVHSRIKDICNRIEFLYGRAVEKGHWGVVKAIVYVLGELCQDGILCDELFQRLDLFVKLAHILSSPVNWYFPLELLAMGVRRGSSATRLSIAQHGSMLHWIFEAHTNDPRAAAFNTIICAHSLEAIFFASPPEPDLLLTTPFTALMYATLRALRIHHDTATLDAIRHGLVVLALGWLNAVMDDSQYMRGSLDLFAALTQNQHNGIRATALRVFLDVNNDHPSRSTGSPGSWPPVVPPELRQLMAEHGRRTCETDLLVQTTESFRRAFSTLADDRDFRKFGSTTASLLQHGPIAYDSLVSLLPPDGEFSSASWADCLLRAGQSLRVNGGIMDLDAADIVELEHLALTRPHQFEAVARSVIHGNPQLGYAYLLLSRFLEDREEALRVAQRGLECKDLSPYLRRQLMFTIADDLLRKSWVLLLSGDLTDPFVRARGSRCLEEGAKIVDAILRDPDIPLDSPELWRVLHYSFVNIVLSAGSNLEVELAEFKRTTLPLIEACETVLEGMGYDLQSNQMRRGREAFLKHLSNTGEDETIDGIAQRFDQLIRDIPAPAYDDPDGDIEHDLYTHWWNVEAEMLIPSTRLGPLMCTCARCPEAFAGAVPLDGCQSCGRPTAALKRCSRCRSVLYCSTDCQRADWPRHRETCAAPN